MTRYPFQANTYGLPTDIVKDCLIGFIENDFTISDKKNMPDERKKTYTSERNSKYFTKRL